MLTASNESTRKSFIPIALLILVTLVGPLLQIGVGSLYHVVIWGVFIATIVQQNFTFKIYNNPIIKFLGVWLAAAIISNIWSVSKDLSLLYTYYILLICAMVYVFTAHFNEKTISQIVNLMVIILFILNIIAMWESFTGNHLNSDYLSTPDRVRLFEYVPATFFNNPNDFSTYLVQITPLNLTGIHSRHKLIKILSIINLPLSAFSVFAAQARIQMIVLGILYISFMLLVLKKRDIIKFILGTVVAVAVLLYFFPNVVEFFEVGMNSLSSDEIQSSGSSGSMAIRIALFKNAMLMMVDSLGFGLGAGCHRVMMAEYSAQHYNTRGVLVAHNLVAELFADYGLLIGFAFLVMIPLVIIKLLKIKNSSKTKESRSFIVLLTISLLLFIISSMSSSSIIQVPSLWLLLCCISGILTTYSVVEK